MDKFKYKFIIDVRSKKIVHFFLKYAMLFLLSIYNYNISHIIAYYINLETVYSILLLFCFLR